MSPPLTKPRYSQRLAAHMHSRSRATSWRCTDVIARIGAIVPGARIEANGAPLPIATAFPADPLLAQWLPGLPHTPLEQGLRETVAFYR